jgi:hypothetical protein
MDVKAVDIIGCSVGDGTRQCVCHDVCGELVTVDDLVVIRWEIELGAENAAEEVFKVDRFSGIQQTCHIGYLQRRLLNRKDEFNNKVAMVVEDYRTSLSLSKRNGSCDNKGLLKAVLMEKIEYINRS